MYKLYNVKTWGSLAIHLLLEELEVPYTNIWMTAEQVAKEDFRELSPLGYIPALGLKDGSTLFESGALVTFLVTAHPDKGLSPPVGSDDFGEFLSWLQFMSVNIYGAMSLIYSDATRAADPAQQAYLAKRADETLNTLWTVLESRLVKEGPWLMGAQFSALDPYAFMLGLWAKPSESALHAKFPHIAHHSKDVRARPKLKAALEAHGVMELGGYGSPE